MNFQVGDTVMHWNHGLGQIRGLEERKVSGESQLYYAVQIQDINIWVPADAMLASRLRRPTSAPAFKKLLPILGGPAEALPIERHERKTLLRTKMASGDAGSLCHVIRDLTSREKEKPLNDDDRSTLKRARLMLLREWGYSLQVPLAQAEDELQELLSHSPTPTPD
ncbi:MAG TPA: CarD family transcriptional regulator [Anaerolineales bacterium]